jgi:general secretion pathway protein B
MSYILDALRRADAERERGRGAVPGLHAQASPVGGAPLSPERGGPAAVWLVAAGAVGVAALAAGGTWWALRPQAPAGPVAVASAPASVPAPAAVAPPAAPAVTPAPAPRPPAAVAGAGAGADVPLPPAAPPAQPAPPSVERERTAAPAAPEPRPAAPSRAAQREQSRDPDRERRAAATPAAPPPAARSRTPEPARPRDAAPAPSVPAARTEAATAVAPPPSGPVFTQAELPEALRTQLPVLKVTGATHSSNPAYRMAIVNGQVLHEGDQAAPGLVLERIEPGRTVWAFRGYRYAVAAQ